MTPEDLELLRRRVSVAGRVTVEPDGAHDLCARLAARYWDPELLATDQVRLALHPETVSRNRH